MARIPTTPGAAALDLILLNKQKVVGPKLTSSGANGQVHLERYFGQWESRSRCPKSRRRHWPSEPGTRLAAYGFR